MADSSRVVIGMDPHKRTVTEVAGFEALLAMRTPSGWSGSA
jgi:hypothetical protein